MQNYGEHNYRVEFFFGKFCLYFFKGFLVFILFASHEIQNTIESGIKRQSLPQAQRIEGSACCIWATWFQVVLRGFLIAQLWTQVSPSLTKQQQRNSFLNGLDHFPHNLPHDWEPFCHTGEAILNQLIRGGKDRCYLELPGARGEKDEGKVGNSHQ